MAMTVHVGNTHAERFINNGSVVNLDELNQRIDDRYTEQPPSFMIPEHLLPEELDAAYAPERLSEETLNTRFNGKVSKGELYLSVDDYPTVQDAVSAAKIANRVLFHPDGTRVVTTSIIDFHAVKHAGPGALNRNGVLFPITQTGSTINSLHVSPTGLDTNDGLSTTHPLLTIQAAANILKNWGYLDGTWNIKLVAGTYTPVLLPDGLETKNFITLSGPAVGHPNVPTAIIDVGGATNGFGISAPANIRLSVANIKITNAVGTLSIGFNAGNNCDIYTDNVHTTNIYSGIQVANNSRLRAKGGIHSGGVQIGVAVGVSTVFTIGYGNNGTVASGVQLLGCYQGVKVTEGSTGHVDYCFFDGCVIGMEVSQNSRVNDVSNDFRNSTTTAIRATYACYANNGNTFTNNVANFINDAYGLYIPIATGAQTPVRVGRQTAQIVHTGVTTKTLLATPFIIPAGYFSDNSKQIQIVIRGTLTTGSGISTIGVDMATTTISGLASAGAATNAAFEATITITALTNNTQKIHEKLIQAVAVVRHSNST